MTTDDWPATATAAITPLNLALAVVATVAIGTAVLTQGQVREANTVIVQLAKPAAPAQNLQPLVDAVNANRRDVLILATNLAKAIGAVRELAQRVPPPLAVPPLASTNGGGTNPAPVAAKP